MNIEYYKYMWKRKIKSVVLFIKRKLFGLSNYGSLYCIYHIANEQVLEKINQQEKIISDCSFQNAHDLEMGKLRHWQRYLEDKAVKTWYDKLTRRDIRLINKSDNIVDLQEKWPCYTYKLEEQIVFGKLDGFIHAYIRPSHCTMEWSSIDYCWTYAMSMDECKEHDCEGCEFNRMLGITFSRGL